MCSSRFRILYDSDFADCGTINWALLNALFFNYVVSRFRNIFSRVMSLSFNEK